MKVSIGQHNHGSWNLTVKLGRDDQLYSIRD